MVIGRVELPLAEAHERAPLVHRLAVEAGDREALAACRHTADGSSTTS